MKQTLAGHLAGAPDRRPPLVLLHGLTFDRTMWQPALAHLAELDPGRQVLALDLAVLRAAGMPYRVVAGNEPEPEYLSWLKDERPPHPRFVLPVANAPPGRSARVSLS